MFKVENLRVAVLAAKAYTALAIRDYIPAGAFANELLARWTCLSNVSLCNFTIFTTWSHQGEFARRLQASCTPLRSRKSYPSRQGGFVQCLCHAQCSWPFPVETFHTNVSQVGDALVHLDPDLVTSVEVGALVPTKSQNFISTCSLQY